MRGLLNCPPTSYHRIYELPLLERKLGVVATPAPPKLSVVLITSGNELVGPESSFNERSATSAVPSELPTPRTVLT